MIYRDPRSGQTQDVAERETVRRQILERAGWVVVAADAAAAPAPTGGVTVKIGDELVVLAPGAQPVAKPGYRLMDVTTNDSEMAEFVEVPVDAPVSKRKRSK